MNRKPYRYAQVHVPYGPDALLGTRSRAEQIVAGLLDDLVNRGPPADLVQPLAAGEALLPAINLANRDERRSPTLRLALHLDDAPWKVSSIQRTPAELLVAW